MNKFYLTRKDARMAELEQMNITLQRRLETNIDWALAETRVKELEAQVKELTHDCADSDYAHRWHYDEVERLRAAIREAKTVVGFVLGWWPGLEDGIRERGDDEALAENKVYLAAKRFRAMTPEGE